MAARSLPSGSTRGAAMTELLSGESLVQSVGINR